jgi:DNA-binding transcriptional MocR family regulator
MPVMDAVPLYRQLADHYRHAIRAGALAPGQRMPSVRELTRRHDVSLSTTLQACRQLEDEGWLHARPRSGFFVRHPLRAGLRAPDEPPVDAAPAVALDPSPYAGMNDRVSDFVARSERASPRFDSAAPTRAPTRIRSTGCAPASAARCTRTPA